MGSLCWKMGWLAALMACTLAACFSTSQSCPQNCFKDNDNETDGSLQILASTATKYGLTLFKQVSADGDSPPYKNVHVVPGSVRTVFDIVYLGAKGKTKEEISTVFALRSVKQSQLLTIYRELIDVMEHNATKEVNYTLKIVVRIYFDKNLKLRECMIKSIGSDIQQIDFRAASEPSRQTINSWVEDQTNNRIVGLIPEGGVTSGTTMMLVNAISFKAAWAKPFHPDDTISSAFSVGDSGSKIVRMMRQLMNVPYGTSSLLKCTAVAVPYSGERVELLILLPDRGVKVKDILAMLTKENLKELRGSLKTTNTLVSLPKTNLTISYDLTGALTSLGVKDAFEASLADFSGFTGSKSAYIPSVYHKTYIAFHEAGTEKEAPVGAERLSNSPRIKVESFEAGRPFVFFIRDTKYDYPISMGLVMDP